MPLTRLLLHSNNGELRTCCSCLASNPSHQTACDTPPSIRNEHITQPHSAVDTFISIKSPGHLQPVMSSEEERQQALDAYRSELLKSRELETKLKDLRLEIRELQKEFDRTEDSIKALQSVGQIIGEVLKQLPDERCMFHVLVVPLQTPTCVDQASASQSSSRPPLGRGTWSAAVRSSTRRS